MMVVVGFSFVRLYVGNDWAGRTIDKPELQPTEDVVGT
jgi:hypothetical protein